MDEKQKQPHSLRNEKLKANRASETEERRKERLRIRREKDRARRRTKNIQEEKKKAFQFPPFYFVFETCNLLADIQKIQGMSSLAL